MSKGKVLVTGGTGYIGSHTIVDLIEKGFEVVSIDNYSNSDASTLDQIKVITGKTIKNYNVDLTDRSALYNELKDEEDIVGIIHFAALKAVGESVEKPLLYFRNNLQGLINILEFAKTHQIRNFIFSSSCTVYGIPEHYPVTEDTPLQPAASPYGRTKQMGEDIILDSSSSLGIQAILLRYFNPAGAHPSIKMGESPINPAANLVPAITETAIGKRKSLTVFGNDYKTRDGSCIRDYIHIMDLARAHTLALCHLLDGKQQIPVGIYNLGIGEGVTVLEVIKAFEKTSGLSLHYTIGPRRPGDVPAIFANYNKARKELHWEPLYDIDDIMSTAWEWEKVRG